MWFLARYLPVVQGGSGCVTGNQQGKSSAAIDLLSRAPTAKELLFLRKDFFPRQGTRAISHVM